MFAFADDDVGHPVTVGFGDVPAARMNERELGDLRTRVLDEFDRIAAWKDGSPELAEFNARMRSRLIEERRTLSKFVNSPPTFGFRQRQLGLDAAAPPAQPDARISANPSP